MQAKRESKRKVIFCLDHVSFFPPFSQQKKLFKLHRKIALLNSQKLKTFFIKLICECRGEKEREKIKKNSTENVEKKLITL